VCSLQARLSRNELPLAAEVNAVTLDLARRYGMHIIQADAWHLQGEICRQQSDTARVEAAQQATETLRREVGYLGPPRR